MTAVAMVVTEANSWSHVNSGSVKVRLYIESLSTDQISISKCEQWARLRRGCVGQKFRLRQAAADLFMTIEIMNSVAKYDIP